jgi:elongation factor P--(R)-beta-lysine ligase
MVTAPSPECLAPTMDDGVGRTQSAEALMSNEVEDGVGGLSPGANRDRERLANRKPALEARARVLSALRRWFEGQGFLDVDTPARVRAPGQEVHLDAIASEDRWLVTSPEYAMKRLCGAGYERIVSIGKCWRAGERGPHHEPEFTMIEWYRSGAPLERIAEDCEAVLRMAAIAASPLVGRRGINLEKSFGRVTVKELLKEHAGINLDGDELPGVLAQKAHAAGIDTGQARAWDDIFFQIWLDRVEPRLAGAGPIFVFDWPIALGALARRHQIDPRFVERFELYAGGLELANAFGELTDPVEQRSRFESETAERRARRKAIYPLDQALLTALGNMAPTAGVALGFDRLMMLVLGATRIRDVLAFADDEI